MPLYEYICGSCEHRFELIQKFSDKLVSVCPTCGGSVRKLWSSSAIQFKGSGWYVTDYAQKGKAESEAVSQGPSENVAKTSPAGSGNTTKESVAPKSKTAESAKNKTVTGSSSE